MYTHTLHEKYVVITWNISLENDSKATGITTTAATKTTTK